MEGELFLAIYILGGIVSSVLLIREDNKHVLSLLLYGMFFSWVIALFYLVNYLIEKSR